jgi:hypothetical protein
VRGHGEVSGIEIAFCRRYVRSCMFAKLAAVCICLLWLKALVR